MLKELMLFNKSLILAISAEACIGSVMFQLFALSFSNENTFPSRVTLTFWAKTVSVFKKGLVSIMINVFDQIIRGVGGH